MSQLPISIPSQSSISIPDAQPDSFREFFKPPSPELPELEAQSSSEIPDSQDSQEFLKAPATS